MPNGNGKKVKLPPGPNPNLGPFKTFDEKYQFEKSFGEGQRGQHGPEEQELVAPKPKSKYIGGKFRFLNRGDK